MKPENEKCVIILDEALPLGVAANTAAILGVAIGARLPDMVGRDVRDGEGQFHAGIIQFPIPVLRGGSESLRTLRARLFAPQFADLTVVDFTGLAQGCKTYEEFAEKMSACPPDALQYIGIAICGGRKKVSRLTGGLPLLR